MPEIGLHDTHDASDQFGGRPRDSSSLNFLITERATSQVETSIGNRIDTFHFFDLHFGTGQILGFSIKLFPCPDLPADLNQEWG